MMFHTQWNLHLRPPLYNGHFLQSPRWTLYRGSTVVFATSPESKLSYEVLEPRILRAYFSVADANWKLPFGFSVQSSCLTKGRLTDQNCLVYCTRCRRKKKTKRKFRLNTLTKNQPVNDVLIVTNWELGVFLCVLSNDKCKGKQKA